MGEMTDTERLMSDPAWIFEPVIAKDPTEEEKEEAAENVAKGRSTAAFLDSLKKA